MSAAGRAKHAFYKAKYYREKAEQEAEARRQKEIPPEEDILELRNREVRERMAHQREITKRSKLTAAQIKKEREETLERLRERDFTPKLVKREA